VKQQKITYRIRQDGVVYETTEGTEGNECERLTQDIENALGTLSNRIHKPEYYKSQQTVTDVTLQHDQDQT
tara:strand:- start:334 stop:546 length:213 start_codon:yes stop_codon:yes gene_type:complete